MKLTNSTILLALLAVPALAHAADPYTVKVVEKAAPEGLAPDVASAVGNQCVQVLDAEGQPLFEYWAPKAIATKAAADKIDKGIAYTDLPESTFMGVLQVGKLTTDYRRQKIRRGVYTLRIAGQPMDGDHMGTSPYNEFCLLCPAADDKKTTPLEQQALHELSAKSTGSHPAVFLLFPGKEAEASPKMAKKLGDHWVLFMTVNVQNGEKKGTMGLGLTLVGASSSA
jgi:hypothetical protein